MMFTNVYVVYQVRYGGNSWWGADPKPVAVFTTLKAANSHKKEKDKFARDFYHRVKILKLEI